MLLHRFILLFALLAHSVLLNAQTQKTFMYNLYEEQQKLEKEAKSRFFFRTPPDKDGSFVTLHNDEKPHACKGDLLARRYRLILNEYEAVQDLCWKRSDSSNTVVLTDPAAIFFKTKNIDGSSLIYIKSDLELRREELKKRHEDIVQRRSNSTRPKLDCVAVYPFITCE